MIFWQPKEHIQSIINRKSTMGVILNCTTIIAHPRSRAVYSWFQSISIHCAKIRSECASGKSDFVGIHVLNALLPRALCFTFQSLFLSFFFLLLFFFLNWIFFFSSLICLRFFSVLFFFRPTILKIGSSNVHENHKWLIRPKCLWSNI